MAKVTTKVGTVSFPNVFKANAFAGQDPKYSTILIFDKGEDISDLEKAIEAALIKTFGEVPAKWVSPLKNGDEKLDKNGEQREEYAGRVYITVKAKEGDAPAIVDANVQPIINESEVYGGMKARVSVSPFAYDYMGKKGVSLYFKGLQKTADGTPFGMSSNPADDFSSPF